MLEPLFDIFSGAGPDKGPKGPKRPNCMCKKCVSNNLSP